MLLNSEPNTARNNVFKSLKGISKVLDEGSVNLSSSPESLEKRGHWPATARKGQNDQISNLRIYY